MKNKIIDIKDKILKNPAEDKKLVFDGLIKNALKGNEKLSMETGADENCAYRINGKYVRSMNYVNNVYKDVYEKGLPEDFVPTDEEKNNVKKGIREALMKRDLALVEILEKRVHLNDNAIAEMEKAVIDAIIKYYVSMEIQKSDVEAYDENVTDEDVAANKDRIVSDYNGYAEKNNMNTLKIEDADDFVRQQLVNERRRAFEHKIVEAKNDVYNRLVKKHTIEESPAFWD